MSVQTINAIGIDGCRGGWVAVNKSIDILRGYFFHTIEEVFEHFGEDPLYLIDMPMGLEDGMVYRTIDKELRNRLKPYRHSSVFTPPCRQSVYSNDYKSALKVNRKILGKGFSIQAWNICPSIRELDTFLKQNPDMTQNVFECHPELCFAILGGGPLEKSKHTQEGRNIRRKLLTQAALTFEYDRGIPETDFLDAAVLCLTGNRPLNIIANEMPFDSEQIPIRLVY